MKYYLTRIATCIVLANAVKYLINIPSDLAFYAALILVLIEFFLFFQIINKLKNKFL